VVTIWTILCMPLLMTILFAVAEVAHLWRARVQLENAVEAAVLATVQEWGRRGGGHKHVGAALAAGQAFGEANTVHGVPVRLCDRKKVPKVAWSFGAAAPGGNGYEFTPDTEATAKFAVILQATVRTPRICRPLLGESLGVAAITAASAAFFDPTESPPRPRLIRIAADR
jgi:Flp pilus assembly protein TadG